MAIPRKLKQRWEAYPTLKEVLKATKNLSVSPFGKTEEGLTDFRGIQLVAPKVEDLKKQLPKTETIFRDSALKDADFSGSLWFDVSLDHSDDDKYMEIENVRFTGSKFDGYYSRRLASVINCDFDSCVFKGLYFYDAKNCRFTNMKKSSRLEFNSGEVENCLFGGYIYKARFHHTTVKNSKFVGTLYDGRFDSESNTQFVKWENVDATEANFVICSVWNHDFSELYTSPSNCVMKLTEAFYERAIANAKAHPTMAEALEKQVEMWLKPHPTTPYEIRSIDDLTALKYTEELSKAFFELVVKAKELVS